MKILLISFYVLSSVRMEVEGTHPLPEEIKGLLMRKYNHLFHKLINKIEHKIKGLERRRHFLRDRVEKARRIKQMEDDFFPPMPTMFPPPPSAFFSPPSIRSLSCIVTCFFFFFFFFLGLGCALTGGRAESGLFDDFNCSSFWLTSRVQSLISFRNDDISSVFLFICI